MFLHTVFKKQTQLLIVAAAIFLTTACCAPTSSRAGACTEILDESGDNWSISIWHPGHYCIGQNLNQSTPRFRLPHQAIPRDPLLIVEKSHVFADLDNHHLITTVNRRAGARVYGFKHAPISSITIGNGQISSTSGPTVFMVDAFDDGKDVRFGLNLAMAQSEGDISAFRATEFILDNLTLEGDNHVIIMQGKKNIIRHCKILGGNGTVNMFGPQLIFEDNEIVLHAKAQANAGDEAPVALYLEDAADSIIRNNRIVIEGRAPGSGAIVLKNSPNVTITGNTITGADAVYKVLDERSSVTANGNMLKR